MGLRPVMADNIAWKIGNGETIPLYSQPWFRQWQDLRATTAQQRGEMVASLLVPGTRMWNFEALQLLFGFTRALEIATMESSTPSPQPATDTLLFTFAKNGVFSVRKAYQLLKGAQPNMADKQFWRWVWKESQLTPKLKVFLWRAVHGALPVLVVLAARIHHLSSLCPICKAYPESVMHALFQCDFAKRFWLVSPLPLRTEGFNHGLKETLTTMIAALNDAEMCSFVCIMWAIWRMRNEVVHGKKAQLVPVCKVFYEKEKEACQLNLISSAMSPPCQLNPSAIQSGIEAEPSASGYECYVDGAWGQNGNAGIGAYVRHNGVIIWWRSKSVRAINPNQAEAKGVLEGYRMLIEKAGGQGVVYSDSMETVLALQDRLPLIVDWRSYEEIWAAWKLQSQGHYAIKTRHCNRENPRLQLAHRLAQQGKQYGWDTGGSSEPVFQLNEMM